MISKELQVFTQMDLTEVPQKQQDTLILTKAILVNPRMLSPIEMKLQLSDVFDKPTLSEVFKGKLQPVLFLAIRSLVSRFLDAFAFTTKLSEVQKDILTTDTLEKLKYESLEDVILFLKQARTGMFGISKKAVDGNTLLGDWLPQYLEQKALLREQNLAQKKEAQVTYITGLSKTLETYKRNKERKEAFLKAKKMAALAKEATKNCDRQMLEDLIVTWSMDKELKPYLNLLKNKRKIIRK